MRILQIAHQYLPEHVGGTELYTRTLGQALVNHGDAVAIFHRRDDDGRGYARRESPAGTVHGAWNGRFTPLRRFRAAFGDPYLHEAFTRAVDESQPDIVHVQHAMGLPLSIFDHLHAAGIPYVVTLWDFWWVCANAQLLTNYSGEVCDGPRAFLNCARCAQARAGWPDWSALRPPLALPHALRNRRLLAVLAGAARLIAPADFVARWYAARQVPSSRLVVVAPGLATPPSTAARNAATQSGALSIGYIGGLTPQKGVHVLLEAFAVLPPSAYLHVAGDPTADSDYYARLESLAGPRVHFHGRLDREGVWALLQKLDVVVVPSLWYETFVFVISEAFAAGVPVIASNLGVVGSRVRDGIDGLLFPPGDVAALADRLRQLHDDPALRARLQGGIEPPPTMEDHVAAIVEIYRDVVDGRMR